MILTNASINFILVNVFSFTRLNYEGRINQEKWTISS